MPLSLLIALCEHPLAPGARPFPTGPLFVGLAALNLHLFTPPFPRMCGISDLLPPPSTCIQVLLKVGGPQALHVRLRGRLHLQGLAFEQRLQYVARRHAMHPDLPACSWTG